MDKMAKIAVWALLLSAAVFAQSSALSRVADAASSLCIGLVQLLPVIAMLMVIVSGVIYAAGQILGAETRARANVWATAALTGALIGLLIYAVAPPIFATIYGGDVACNP